MTNYNTPEIQSVMAAVQQEIDEMLPESVKAMYGTADDCIKRIHSEMTQEDWAKYGKREGESDLEHYRRCSSQLWANDPRGVPVPKLTVEQTLAQAIHDNDMESIDAQLEMLSQSDWTDTELQQYSMEREGTV